VCHSWLCYLSGCLFGNKKEGKYLAEKSFSDAIQKLRKILDSENTEKCTKEEKKKEITKNKNRFLLPFSSDNCSEDICRNIVDIEYFQSTSGRPGNSGK
jgi:hypothetical protein